MAHSLLKRTMKDASGRLHISVGFLAHPAQYGHSHTSLEETMGGSKQEECWSEHLELERFREL